MAQIHRFTQRRLWGDFSTVMPLGRMYSDADLMVGWFIFCMIDEPNRIVFILWLLPNIFLKRFCCCTGLDILCLFLFFMYSIYTHRVCVVYTDVYSIYIYMRMIFTSFQMSLHKFYKFYLFGHLTFFSCEMTVTAFPSAISRANSADLTFGSSERHSFNFRNLNADQGMTFDGQFVSGVTSWAMNSEMLNHIIISTGAHQVYLSR